MMLLRYEFVLRAEVRTLFSYESRKAFEFLLSESSIAIYASIRTPMVSICTVITPSLYKSSFHQQNGCLQRHVLHHSNDCSRKKWLVFR
jgi:hypothetical protein